VGRGVRRLTVAELVRFLRATARRLPGRTRFILTGGVEAMLLGGTRPTGDVDFGVVAAGRLDEIEAAIQAAASEAGLAVQYSTDVDRWSSVAIPRSRLRTRPYRRIGRLSIHLLEPKCWAVYKLARYLDADVEDLRSVLRRERPSAPALARLCGESLRASPRSTQLFSFRRHVEHFFSTHGRHVWGPRFDAARAVRAFHRAAAIPARR
jgi:hypothetical protein